MTDKQSGVSGSIGSSGVHYGHPECIQAKGMMGNCTCPQSGSAYLRARIRFIQSSDLAASMGAVRQTLTAYGPASQTAFARSEMRERPFFYTPVYVLYDAILAAREIEDPTAEQFAAIVYAPEVETALAALTAAKRDVSSGSGFSPETEFCRAIRAMRSWVAPTTASQ